MSMWLGAAKSSLNTRMGHAARWRFVDKIRLEARAGAGGNGCNSFEALGPRKLRRRGKANGGNAGAGGDVIVRANASTGTLDRDSFNLRAGDGDNGGVQRRHGKKGRSVYIDVPLGTVVRFVTVGEGKTVWSENRVPFEEVFEKTEENQNDTADDIADENEMRIEFGLKPIEHHVQYVKTADLIEEGDCIVVASGGRSGLGNVSNRGPDRELRAERSIGLKGSRVKMELELKMIADVGLIGYPNAGKSTLLSQVTRASPKIGAYPFTTLYPNKGVVGERRKHTRDEFDENTRFSIADVPGLVEDAHLNKGLGHAFLRHVERNRCLVFVVDVVPDNGKDPLDILNMLCREVLIYFSKGRITEEVISKPFSVIMERKPCIIFANKCDLSETISRDQLERIRNAVDIPVYAGSALTGEGTTELVEALREMVVNQKARKAIGSETSGLDDPDLFLETNKELEDFISPSASSLQ